MNIKLLSDIHLEFGSMDPGSGDVLILAGDILVAKDLSRWYTEGKRHSYRYNKFLKKCGENYNKVFYVIGNHEHYGSDINKTAEVIQEFLPENFTLLDNNTECYQGVNYIGGTLWTNYNNNLEDQLTAWDNMNDYYQINDDGSPLVPTELARRHQNTMKYFEDTLPSLTGPVIVVTHHAPHPNSFCENYRDPILMPAYCSDLTDFIKEHKIDLWCHGHIHKTNNYIIENTRVLSNPRGYNNYEVNESFNVNFELNEYLCC